MRVNTVVPNFDEELKVFKCISPLCKAISKKQFHIVRYIKRCPKIVDRKKQVKKNRTCRYCGATFVRKSNCDRHIFFFLLNFYFLFLNCTTLINTK